MPYNGLLNLDVVHYLEVPRVLYRAAENYRGAGRMLSGEPGLATIWDDYDAILEVAAAEAERKLVEAGLMSAQG